MAAPLPGETKAHWQPRRAPDAPLPLLGIYLLQPGVHGSSQKPAWVSSLRHPQALMDLISNTFWVHPHETTALAKDMVCLGQLLRSVAVSRLAFELTDRGLRAVEDLIVSSSKPMVQ